MKNQTSLYFDMWRKRYFTELLRVYTQTADKFKLREEMIVGFGDMLDRYIPDGRGRYTGTNKQWSTVYILGRELGIFRRKIGESYELSKLAKDFLESKILGSEYLLNYLLNLNQLIDGRVIHPLFEVLLIVEANGGVISKENVFNIPEFQLYSRNEKNRRQIVNIFFHRMMEAGVLVETGQKDLFRLSPRFKVKDLLEHCRRSEKTPEEFEKVTHEEFVDKLSFPNPLIPVYKSGGTKK